MNRPLERGNLVEQKKDLRIAAYSNSRVRPGPDPAPLYQPTIRCGCEQQGGRGDAEDRGSPSSAASQVVCRKLLRFSGVERPRNDLREWQVAEGTRDPLALQAPQLQLTLFFFSLVRGASRAWQSVGREMDASWFVMHQEPNSHAPVKKPNLVVTVVPQMFQLGAIGKLLFR